MRVRSSWGGSFHGRGTTSDTAGGTNMALPMAHRSGRLQVRMPSSLHEALVRAAIADGVSLNQFICCVLSGAVRWRAGAATGAAQALGGGEDGRDKDEHVWEFWRQAFRDH
jgi:hypothetical protein